MSKKKMRESMENFIKDDWTPALALAFNGEESFENLDEELIVAWAELGDCTHEEVASEYEEVWDDISEGYLEDEVERIEEENILYEVLTVRDIRKKYGISDSAIRKAITAERLRHGTYRKSGGTWLILESEAGRIWGDK